MPSARDWITCACFACSGDPDTPTRGCTKTSSRFAGLGFSFCSLSKASFARFQNEKTFSILSRRFLCPGLDFLRPALRDSEDPKKVVLPKAFHRLWRCRLFHLLAFVNKFTTLANKKASQTSFERLCARDWIRTSIGFQRIIIIDEIQSRCWEFVC